ncbi:MAG: ATP-binding protein, partial [Gammaproteobacteria bacterium]|nr:ATP-binding protein [Gammaproteobacteria bacterium]
GARRQEDEFLAMLAHELRNPLAPISNAVQLLKMQETGNHPDFLPRAVAIIDRQVEQIARLVDDLLDVARITRGRIDLKKELAGLTDIMKQAVETVTPVMQMNEHTFRVSFPRKDIILNADATRMIQVISNLLNNAAKFTPKGGEIMLSAAREGDIAAISVTDNGVGISPDMLPHVFELFTQEDRSLDRRQGGLGLGLSLVKRLVEMHSGTVEAESAGTGRGSRFTVRLPIAAESAEVSDLGSSGVLTSTSAARKLRILVVDDNVESAEAMAMLLRTLGHEVTAAHSGQQALNAAQQNMPEVVFLDIGLPVMDGYEVARRLRAAYGRERLMLVALTGYAQNPDDTRVQQAQFDHYVLKPLSFEHLQSLLSEWPN